MPRKNQSAGQKGRPGKGDADSSKEKADAVEESTNQGGLQTVEVSCAIELERHCYETAALDETIAAVKDIGWCDEQRLLP